MAESISALQYRPADLVREVSLDAIAFFVNELSGLYLPEEFKNEHKSRTDVRCWDVKDRLTGKFGRYALYDIEAYEKEEADEPRYVDDLLVIGTTIGLHGLNYDKEMWKLYHRDLLDKNYVGMLEARGLQPTNILVQPADYGHTSITIDAEGGIKNVVVDGASFDFGRANKEGREKTVELFRQLLKNEIEVVNGDPEPKRYDTLLAMYTKSA